MAARDLGLVTAEECRARCAATLSTLDAVERHEPSGMLANWYSETTGELLHAMPDGGRVLTFMSSVDNGWLAAGLLVVEGAVPALAADARRLRRAPGLWGRNHPATVAAHRDWATEHGWDAWGWSPAAKPGEGYSEWGVDAVAWLAEGYPSALDGDPVVTPHAAAMALLHDPEAATECLVRLEELGCYGPGGFVDVVALRSRRTAGRHLVLDQSMVMAALAHALGHPLRRWFATPEVEAVLRPVLAARGWPDESERMPGRDR